MLQRRVDQIGAAAQQRGQRDGGLGEPLGPREQRSFRYPMPLEADLALGEYTLVAKVYYNTREKDAFFSVVYNDTVSLVPTPPSKDAQAKLIQAVVGGGGLLLLLLALSKRVGAAAKPKAAKKAAAAPAAADGGEANEWLAGTLAGSEGKKAKKSKKN